MGSSMPEDSGVDGLSLFMRTIPFNLYALLTILFMVILISRQVDFGTMRRYEEKLKTEKEQLAVGAEETRVTGHGGVIDLVLPIVVLIAAVHCGDALHGRDSGRKGDPAGICRL